MSEAPAIETFLTPGLTVGAGVAVTTGVREYVKAVRAHLAQLHRAGALAQAVNEARSDLIDRLVRRLFDLAEAEYYAGGGREISPLAVTAVGGYARREMSIHSDVDLLFLHAGAADPYVAAVTERMQLFLWDATLEVGCATRTIAETLDLAGRDATVATAILDSRFIIGNARVFHEFSARVREALLADAGGFIDAQEAALRQRHAKYGDSLYLLQPNLKEGAGGLRDYHAANWAMRAAQPSTRGFEDLLHLGFLTELEMQDYRAALQFLWRVRNELHLITGRHHDQMSFEHQELIAENLGYGAPDGAELPVERFMRDYYRHARAIRNFSQIVLEQSRARVRPAVPAPTREVEDGFRLAPDHLEIPHGAHLRERPARLVIAFAVAQSHDVPLSRTALRLVRENLSLVDDGFRTDPEVNAGFLGILGAEHRVMRTLMQMNEVGLLGRFLPEWDHIVCRWQHVLYHTYTVDVHSIFLVEELRRLYKGKYERSLPALTDMIRANEDRVALFLGCLLHDVGKGLGGDHSNRGIPLAQRCVERLGLAPERAARVVFLVRQHLLMSHLAQRRDLSDPRLIVEFARWVGDRTNLRNLYLLTFADIRASSPAGWTVWKGQLLQELFERTSEFLETGGHDPAKAIELIETRVEVRQEGARAELARLGVSQEKIQEFFEDMPRRYFVSHTPRQIARHARVVLSYSRDRVLSTSVREMRGGFSEFLLCTKDVFGLFSNMAGVFTAKGINILGANVYTTRSGLALEVYRLSTPEGGEEERRETWAAVEKTLTAVLRGEADVDELVRRRRRPIGRMPSPSRKPPSVSVSNSESDFYTIVDVSANDRQGLLHALTRTLREHGLEIYISKAATIMDQASDTFYVKDRQRKKLTRPARIEALREALLEAARDPEVERG